MGSIFFLRLERSNSLVQNSHLAGRRSSSSLHGGDGDAGRSANSRDSSKGGLTLACSSNNDRPSFDAAIDGISVLQTIPRHLLPSEYFVDSFPADDDPPSFVHCSPPFD
jgi:hypothetical protein